MNNNDNRNVPHVVREVICVKCYRRWISAAPVYLQLRDYECPNCGKSETVIATGQEFSYDKEE